MVVLTNGDGYSLAAREYFRRPTLSHEDYLRFGRIRMEEARQATRRLGIGPQDVVFLGFPDRGLVRLLLQGSTQSPFAGVSAVPYRECLRPDTPYTRQQFEQQLRDILEDFQPTLVLFPSARDGHPDHRAAYYLTRDVLAGLYPAESLHTPARFLTYLVHPPRFLPEPG